MYCHANPFMMNSFYTGCHCCNNFYNYNYDYYNPFGPTTRFMINEAFQFNIMMQNYAMNQYLMPVFNSYYPRVYTYPQMQMPVFNSYYPRVYTYPQMQMPVRTQQVNQMPAAQPAINYGDVFNNNFNVLLNGNKTGSSISSGSSVIDTGKLDKNVLDKVKQVAKNLNCDYKDLLAVINSESGFNTKAQNGSAVGLIQFTSVAREELKRVYGINVTKEQILKMSVIEQLDLAEKYLKVAKSYSFGENDRLSAEDLYAITFLPGRASRDVLCSKGEGNSYYESNKGLDLNSDGKITKADLQTRLKQKRVNESIFA